MTYTEDNLCLDCARDPHRKMKAGLPTIGESDVRLYRAVWSGLCQWVSDSFSKGKGVDISQLMRLSWARIVTQSQTEGSVSSLIPVFLLHPSFQKTYSVRGKKSEGWSGQALETTCESLNPSTLALRYTSTMTKDVVAVCLRELIHKLGKNAGQGERMSIDCGVGKLVCSSGRSGQTFTFDFHPQYQKKVPHTNAIHHSSGGMEEAETARGFRSGREEEATLKAAVSPKRRGIRTGGRVPTSSLPALSPVARGAAGSSCPTNLRQVGFGSPPHLALDSERMITASDPGPSFQRSDRDSIRGDTTGGDMSPCTDGTTKYVWSRREFRWVSATRFEAVETKKRLKKKALTQLQEEDMKQQRETRKRDKARRLKLATGLPFYCKMSNEEMERQKRKDKQKELRIGLQQQMASKDRGSKRHAAAVDSMEDYEDDTEDDVNNMRVILGGMKTRSTVSAIAE